VGWIYIERGRRKEHGSMTKLLNNFILKISNFIYL